MSITGWSCSNLRLTRITYLSLIFDDTLGHRWTGLLAVRSLQNIHREKDGNNNSPFFVAKTEEHTTSLSLFFHLSSLRHLYPRKLQLCICVLYIKERLLLLMYERIFIQTVFYFLFLEFRKKICLNVLTIFDEQYVYWSTGCTYTM